VKHQEVAFTSRTRSLTRRASRELADLRALRNRVDAAGARDWLFDCRAGYNRILIDLEARAARYRAVSPRLARQIAANRLLRSACIEELDSLS
jgi:hypothetical protein